MPWNQIHRSWDAVESEITVKTKDRKKNSQYMDNIEQHTNHST